MEFTSPQRRLLESDVRLRHLQRAAATGDPEAVAAYRAATMRSRENTVVDEIGELAQIFAFPDSPFGEFISKLKYGPEYVQIMKLAETIRNQIKGVQESWRDLDTAKASMRTPRVMAATAKVESYTSPKRVRKLVSNLKQFTKAAGPGTDERDHERSGGRYFRPGGKWADSPEADNLLSVIARLEDLLK